MRKRILIAEQNPETAAILYSLFTWHGYEVRTAFSYAPMMELLSRERFDVLTLNAHLPDGDAKMQRRLFDELPTGTQLLVLDLSASKENRVSVEKNSYFGLYLQAPLDSEGIVRTIDEMTGGCDESPVTELKPFRLHPDSLFDLLLGFYLLGTTAAATFRRRGINKTVYFLGGVPRFVSSSVISDRLGNLLIAEGVINEQQLNSMLLAQKESGGMLGRMAVDRGYLKEDQLQQYLARQVASIVISLFEWTEGSYMLESFEQDSVAIGELYTHPFLLLLEGIRSGYDVDRILSALPSASSFMVPTVSGALNLKDADFSEQELSLISLIDGTRTIKDLVEISPMDLVATESLILALFRAGLIRSQDALLKRPSGILRKQVKRVRDEHFFNDEFFEIKYEDTSSSESASPGVEVFPMEKVEPGSYGKMGIFAWERHQKEEKITDPHMERPRNSGRLLFVLMGAMAVFGFVLLLATAKPPPGSYAPKPQWSDSYGQQIITPVFLRAQRHYENGLTLLEENTPASLEQAVEEFAAALFIDRRFHEAYDAMTEAQFRLETMNGGQGVPMEEGDDSADQCPECESPGEPR